jgi:hypothetical protein
MLLAFVFIAFGCININVTDAPALDDDDSTVLVEPSVLLEDGTVYYIDENGEEKVVVISVTYGNDDMGNRFYKMAELSPNKEFILMGKAGWEQTYFEVYSIATSEVYRIREVLLKGVEWINDGRIRAKNDCERMDYCATFESKTSEKPWELEKISDYQE